MKKILTPKEKEIFNLLIKHKTTKQIAQELNISEKTIRNHISNVIQRLDTTNRSNAILELIKLGELDF